MLPVSEDGRQRNVPKGGSASRKRAGALLVTLAAAAFDACSAPTQGIDLLALTPHRLIAGSVGEQDTAWVRAHLGAPQRIHGVIHASLPATPPSRLSFAARVPGGGRLALAAGIPGRYRGDPAVEFVVKVRNRGRETAVLSRLVDPANEEADRAWVPLEADLSEYAGRDVEIVLETRGFGRTSELDRAYWGTPVITAGANRTAPLVIVYLVDTLRADHLSLYGYERETAAELERFARDAVVFDQAIASSSWTKPSVASLFTSLPPGEHGCVQFYSPLDPSRATLAERLRDAGYATGAVVANGLLLAKGASFDQGFAYFAGAPEPQRAAQAVDVALAFLDRRRGLPTFLYVHTMDPHSPYAPPAPFDSRFGPAPRPGRRAAEPTDYREPADLARIVAQYDGEVAYGDREFGRFVRELEARGLYDRALVVFLSDHGEEFRDHGDWVHGQTLFDELVRVPLVVKYPDGQHAGRRVERQVQLVDVLPTILKSQGLPAPDAQAVIGRPLEEAFAGTTPERPATFETKYREHVAYGARTGTHKYVRQLSPVARELYLDLVRDPRERVNQLADAGDPGQELRRAAEAALRPAAFRHELLVTGTDVYELQVRTTGWIERVEANRLGSSERARVEEGGQVLTLRLEPQPGLPRSASILTRPHGAPLWVDGTRGRRRLRAGDIRMGADGVRAGAVPFQVPDVEDVLGLFSPPGGDESGIAVWITPVAGGESPTFRQRGPRHAPSARLRTLTGEGVMRGGTLKLDPSKSPAWIDVAYTEGREKGPRNS